MVVYVPFNFALRTARLGESSGLGAQSSRLQVLAFVATAPDNMTNLICVLKQRIQFRFGVGILALASLF